MKNKRLIMAGAAFIVVCLAIVKTGVMQVVCSTMQDAIAGTTTIAYNTDPNSDTIASVSPDVHQIAFCRETKEFFLQDLKTRKITAYPTADKIYQVKYSPDGTYVAAGKNVLDVKTGRMLLLDTDAVIIPAGKGDYMAFSPDSKMLAIVNEIDGPPGVPHRPTVIEIWDLKTEKLVHILPLQEVVRTLSKWGTIIRDMAFSPDGQYLAVAGTTITLWDVKEGKYLKSLMTNPVLDDKSFNFRIEYESVAYSPDGKYLAAALLIDVFKQGSQGTSKEMVEIWDPHNGEVVKLLEDADMTSISKVKYSPDGQYIAVGKDLGYYPAKGAVWIWNGASGQLDGKLQGFPDHSTNSLDYSADGKYLSASGFWHIKIWKLE